ncbi:MAG: IS6 family transposase [Myxococcales bacterium]|nr:IS6 family transposase [Myxococcales bacterium]
MFKGCHFPKPIIVTCIRWYLRYKLSYRDLEEMMAERGVSVDHATINRWVVKFAPMLTARARRHKMPVGKRWRMDETYVRIRGQWRYLYRAVDKQGRTVDFLLATRRDTEAAQRFLRAAVARNGCPSFVNIDKSGANAAGIAAYNAETGAAIEVRQCRYLNNVVEQDHRFVKQRVRAALGFQTFHTARATLAGIELVHMLRKGQVRPLANGSDAEQFRALAA